MNIEEINRKKSGDSENNHILNSLGLIIFVILSLVYLVLSTNYGLSGDFEIGRVFGIGLWFLLPWLFLTHKKVENAINYSSILPIIGILAAISQLYTTERINKNEIEIPEPIKSTGKTFVLVKLGPELEAKIRQFANKSNLTNPESN